MWVKTEDRMRFTALVAGLSGLAWLGLWVWERSPYSRFLSHHSLDSMHRDATLLLVYISGWIVMVVAMMLPASLPFIITFQRLHSQRTDVDRLSVLLIAGYLLIWTLFGVVVYASDWLLHQAVHRYPWLHAHAWMLTALPLLVAGTYQFTPFKRLALDSYHTGQSCLARSQEGYAALSGSFVLGLRHGLFCVGGCWSLMLLMFALGAGNLGGMLGLSAIMSIEKNVPWGRRLVTPIGVALISGALVLFLAGSAIGSGHAGHMH